MSTKAILVIDMPNDCDECQLNSNGYCVGLQEYALLNEWVEDAPYYSLKKKGDCPLKPMPNKRVPDGSETDQIYGCYVGWNTCLKEIGDDGEW